MKVRLFLIAHGRSGDKGDTVNIGVIARAPSWYEFMRTELSAGAVEEFLKPLARGPVERYELPNLDALNFVVHGALEGGGSVSPRTDAQGKTYAQALMRYPVELPATIAKEVVDYWHGCFPRGTLIEGNV